MEDDLGPGTQGLDANEQAFSFATSAVLPGRIRLGAAVSYLALITSDP